MKSLKNFKLTNFYEKFFFVRLIELLSINQQREQIFSQFALNNTHIERIENMLNDEKRAHNLYFILCLENFLNH